VIELDTIEIERIQKSLKHNDLSLITITKDGEVYTQKEGYSNQVLIQPLLLRRL